jgi:hypothetical protein
MLEFVCAMFLFSAAVASAPEAMTPAPECIPFRLDATSLIQTDGEWFIVSGDTRLNGFGKNQDQAERALEIIKHYGINERCNAGLPTEGYPYWLADGQPPAGALVGEICLSFHPDRIKIKQVDENWKIMEGRRQILSFRDEQTVQAVFEVVQTHGFSNFCFVGRPEPRFLYMRR